VKIIVCVPRDLWPVWNTKKGGFSLKKVEAKISYLMFRCYFYEKYEHKLYGWIGFPLVCFDLELIVCHFILTIP
jgi:hypothetical protein